MDESRPEARLPGQEQQPRPLVVYAVPQITPRDDSTARLVIVAVAIAVAVLISVWGWKSYGPGYELPPQDVSLSINIARSGDGSTWIITITRSTGSLRTDQTYLTIFRPDGVVNLSRTAFSALTFAQHGVAFSGDGDSFVDVTERLLLRAIWYPTGSNIRISDPYRILVSAHL